ncbi:hypothetical protein ACU686_35650, partial [Yinghuangia aomiensis]
MLERTCRRRLPRGACSGDASATSPPAGLQDDGPARRTRLQRLPVRHEWAYQPEEGRVSRAAIAHYRAMVVGRSSSEVLSWRV